MAGPMEALLMPQPAALGAQAAVGGSSLQVDASWQTRLGARWRWLARRWAFAFAGLALGLAVGWVLALDRLNGHERAVQALQDLQQQWAAQPPPRAVPAPVAPQALARLPVVGQPAATWLALQQVLAVHRVAVLSLRPLDDVRTAPLPNQTVALRLQARFGDWVAAWSGLSQAGPVWSIERLRITPMANADVVEIDVVLRVWMRDGPAQTEGEAAWVQAAKGQREAVVDEAVFARPQVFVQGGEESDRQGVGQKRLAMQASEARPNSGAPGDANATRGVVPATPVTPVAGQPAVPRLVFAPEPERIPFAPWRLLGIWQHGGHAQAWLASGTHWFQVSAGQPMSLEGHFLESVAADRVTWRDRLGQLTTLTFESKAP